MKIFLGVFLYFNLVCFMSLWGSEETIFAENLFEELPILEFPLAAPPPFSPKIEKIKHRYFKKEKDSLTPFFISALKAQKSNSLVSLPGSYKKEFYPFLIETSFSSSSLERKKLKNIEIFSELYGETEEVKKYIIYLVSKNANVFELKSCVLRYNSLIISSPFISMNMYRLSFTTQALKDNPFCLINHAYTSQYELKEFPEIPVSKKTLWSISQVDSVNNNLIFTLKQSAKSLEEYTTLPTITVTFKAITAPDKSDEEIFPLEY